MLYYFVIPDVLCLIPRWEYHGSCERFACHENFQTAQRWISQKRLEDVSSACHLTQQVWRNSCQLHSPTSPFFSSLILASITRDHSIPSRLSRPQTACRPRRQPRYPARIESSWKRAVLPGVGVSAQLIGIGLQPHARDLPALLFVEHLLSKWKILWNRTEIKGIIGKSMENPCKGSYMESRHV